MSKLRIALTKGRLEKDITKLFTEIGFNTENLINKGRKLIIPISDEIEVVLAKSNDVITYVEHGVCDLGVVGYDTIYECDAKCYEIIDLGFGKCKFAVATKDGKDIFKSSQVIKIASKYPNVTKRYFESLGMDVDIIKIDGSVELAPLLGLCDAIVDIVETGSTLKENGLAVIRDVCPISARLISNIVSLKTKKAEIEELAEKMRGGLRD